MNLLSIALYSSRSSCSKRKYRNVNRNGSQWNVHVNPCAETLDAKRQKKPNPRAPSVSLFGICFTLVFLVPIVFPVLIIVRI